MISHHTLVWWYKTYCKTSESLNLSVIARLISFDEFVGASLILKPRNPAIREALAKLVLKIQQVQSTETHDDERY